MVNLSHEELLNLVEELQVGQVWKCLENNHIILISLVKPNELHGYLFNGFEVARYLSLSLIDFVRYFEMIHNPRSKKGS